MPPVSSRDVRYLLFYAKHREILGKKKIKKVPPAAPSLAITNIITNIVISFHLYRMVDDDFLYVSTFASKSFDICCFIDSRKSSSQRFLAIVKFSRIFNPNPRIFKKRESKGFCGNRSAKIRPPHQDLVRRAELFFFFLAKDFAVFCIKQYLRSATSPPRLLRSFHFSHHRTRASFQASTSRRTCPP